MIFTRFAEFVHVKDDTKVLDTVQDRAVGVFIEVIEKAGPFLGIGMQSKVHVFEDVHLSWLVEVSADEREFEELREKTPIRGTLDAAPDRTEGPGVGL